MAQPPINITLPTMAVTPDERPEDDPSSFEGPADGGPPGSTLVQSFDTGEEFSDTPPSIPGSTYEGSMSPAAPDRFSAMGKGLLKGIEESAVITGALGGAEAGFAYTPPFLPIVGPFAKPLGAVGGAIAGGITGYLAGEAMESTLPDYSQAGIDPSLMPEYEGARTTGAAIAMFPLAYGIPQMTANRVGRFLSGIGDAARKYPVSFGASEIIGGVGAGLGGGAATYYAPGEAGTRFVSEFVGGVAMPGRFLISLAGKAKELGGSLVGRFTKDSRQGRAGENIARVLEEAGTDIPALIRRLEKPQVLDDKGKPISVSSAQKTGDLGLTILENTLARDNTKFGSEISAQGQSALSAHKGLVSRLREIGNPDAFFLAAQEEKALHEALIDTRLSLAEKKAADAIAKIKVDTPESRQQIGAIVQRNVTDALKDARAHEKTLWNRSNKASVVTKMVKGKPVLEYQKVMPTNTAESFLDIATSMTPERLYSADLNDVVSMMSRLGIDKQAISRYAQGKLTPEYLETGKVPREYLTKVVQEKPAVRGFRARTKPGTQTAGPGKTVSIVKETNVNDLVNIRSDLLAFVRKAAASGDVADVRVFGNIAESALDDLGSVNNPAFDEARNFSRTLNDYFTRTFAGDMGAVTRTGAEKLPAEILISRAFAGGADVTSLRMQNIEDAVSMFGKQYEDAVAQFGAGSKQAQDLKGFADTAAQNIISIRDANARTMRLAASKAVNPDGSVNLLSLQRFAAENKPTLDRLGITADIEDVVKAENAFKALGNEFSVLNKNLVQQEAFAQAIKSGNASKAVSDAIKSPNPVKSFEGLVKLAKRGDPAAVEGLKSAVYDYAFTKAGGGSPDGRINIKAFNEALFGPVQYGKPSVYNILRSQGAITTEEGKRLQQLIRPMMRIEEAINTNQVTSDIVTGADAMTELFLKIGGARAGATAGKMLPGGGGQLIAASAGSQALRKQFDKLPSMMTRSIIEEAAKDPALMALMLKKAKTPAEKFTLARQVHAYITAAGMNYANFDDTPIPVDETPLVPSPTRTQARGLLKQMPTVQTRGTVVSPRPAMPAPGGASGPPAPVGQGTSSRKMLQSLFPRDDISAIE